MVTDFESNEGDKRNAALVIAGVSIDAVPDDEERPFVLMRVLSVLGLME